MIKTSDVFTPAKLPTYTDVDRTQLSEELKRWMRHGGYFLSVMGTTKLGKTTLIKNFLNTQTEDGWSIYIPGQSLQEGAQDLWKLLVNEFGIPTSQETGYASSDKSTWKILTKLAAKVPGLSASLGLDVSGEKQKTETTSNKFDVLPSRAVTEAIDLIREQDQKVFIAVDDFHFVLDAAARKSIVLALRPLAEEHGCSVILSTIPGGQEDVAFKNTNIGGRRKSIEVPKWHENELKQIARQGLSTLSLSLSEEAVSRLAKESFGSPQIMQQLCLDLCEETNKILEREENDEELLLTEPSDWDKFFVSLKDDEAVNWVTKLSSGPNPRKKRKRKSHPGPPPHELDGYQLIMRALHELGSPHEVALSNIKQHIGERLGISGAELNNLALEMKARNLHMVASKDTKEAVEQQALRDAGLDWELDEDAPIEDEEDIEKGAFAELLAATAIPQPVFEAKGSRNQAVVRILDPLLCYALKWHPEAIMEARAY